MVSSPAQAAVNVVSNFLVIRVSTASVSTRTRGGIMLLNGATGRTLRRIFLTSGPPRKLPIGSTMKVFTLLH